MNSETVSQIKSMDSIQKLSIYIHYYVTTISLKHDFLPIEKKLSYFKEVKEYIVYDKYYEKSDKETIGTSFYYLWKDFQIKSFDEFISDKNINVMDFGSDWKQQGYAQQIHTEYYGIYEWWGKFKHEIKLA